MEHLEAIRNIRQKVERLGEENLRLQALLAAAKKEKDQLASQLETLGRQQNQLEKKNLNLQIAQTLKEGDGQHEDLQTTEQLKDHIDKLMKEIDRCIHLLKYDNEL